MTDWYDRLHWLEYDSGVALRYHGRRKEFLDRLSRLDPALSVIFGGTAFATIVAGHLHIAAWAAAMTAAFSAVDLAFGLGDRARMHESIFRRWGELRTRLARLSPEDERQLQELEAERAAIDAESPGQLLALSALCENEEKKARREGRLSKIGWLQRVVADWFTWPGWTVTPDDETSKDQLRV